MTQTQAWMAQVESDNAALQRVYRADDGSTYCQAVAKCQQIAEKLIKAMVASINDTGIDLITIGKSHYPSKELDALIHVKRVLHPSSIKQIELILTEKQRQVINEVCLLAPAFPEPGKPFQKNTEYPFQREDGTWTAPAAFDSFSEAEVRRFMEMVWVLRPKITKFVSTVRRGR